MTRYERLVEELRQSMGRLTGLEGSEVGASTSFFELGADSLALLQFSQTVQEVSGVKVPFRLLLDELTTIEALASFVEERLGPEQSPAAVRRDSAPLPEAEAKSPHADDESSPRPAPAPAGTEPSPLPASATPASATAGLEQILTRQLEVMAEQLALLRGSGADGAAAAGPGTGGPQPAVAAVPESSIPATTATRPPAGGGDHDAEEFVPYRPLAKAVDGLGPQQRAHLDALIERVTEKTRESKRLTQLHRPHHADSRPVTGFRRLWKELCYPLTVTDGYGGRIRDVDGNEYVDLAMGFGALLFGHSPPFLVKTLEEQVPRGVRLGPQSYLAGEVAQLISELTGVERVTFCNSGSEAVMTALRVARAHTGRDRVAMFAGSYHGIADEVLARTEAAEPGGQALPLAPGIPASALADMRVYRYNRPESLEALRSQAQELAAVLIEPPRSRTPDIQPAEFLRELRRLTAECGAALIFDEVVTGFRSHPGGAQAIFGVEADLVTYGKAAAGGMPIGIVAGRQAWMDAIDGGMWQYGDDSMPEVEMTYHAGTFCKHPYTMPVAKAVLEHLRDRGPALQEELSQRTTELVSTLTDLFETEGHPLRVANFGSLFRFFYPPANRLGELFYFHLLENGVYVWEGRNCFLSTAHTDEDLEQIVRAVRRSAAALREGGILPAAPKRKRSQAVPSAPAPDTATGAGENAGDTAPLTEAQEQLWVLAQLGDEGSRAYNESLTLSLHGELDVPALHQALETVVTRHEALRATFSADGQRQRFKPPGPTDMPVVDLRAFAGDELERRIDELVASEASRVFDLTHGPLLRASLLRAGDDRHLLVLTFHHLICDGISNGIVLSELARLYSAARRGQECELPPVMSFREFVARQSDERRGSEMRRAEDYWMRLYADPAPSLNLPIDRPRPPLQGRLGDRARLWIGAELSDRVRAFSGRHRATLLVTLLTAYQILLHRLSGQSDLVVGVPAAGQLGAGRVVGYCINLLPLRSRPDPDTSAAEHLRATRQSVYDAYEHQLYPFGRLIKKLDLPRDPSRLPMVSVTFNAERAGVLKFDQLEAEVLSNSTGGSKFELFLNAIEHPDGLELDCEYNAHLFGAATLGRWLRHLRQGLAAMLAEPDAPLWQLSMLTRAQRHQILAEWNDTEAESDTSQLIHQLFETQSRVRPEAQAVVFADRHLSYRQLDREADRLARHLGSVGVVSGHRVAVLMSRSLEMVPALLGILKAGGAYVPLETAYPFERLRWILETLRIEIVLGTSRELAVLSDLSRRLSQIAHVVLLDPPEIAAAPREAASLSRARLWSRRDFPRQPAPGPPVRISPDLEAYVIFTSGSTGTPKGVVETHRPVVNLIRWVTEAFGVGPDDRVLFITSIGFDLSVYDVFGLLAAGGSIRVASDEDLKDPERLLAWLDRDVVTFWDSAPAALQQIVPFFDATPAPTAGSSLRLVFQSGDWIPLALPDRVRERFPRARVVALGGATEATVWSNYHQVREIGRHWSSIPYGRPIAGARYYVLDDLEPSPIGVAGDLLIGGECLSSGYAQAPALTAERYLPDPFSVKPGAVMYRTGDRARFFASGEIEFLGRLDTQVKVRGFRIELGEIETVLAEHPGIREAAVLARESAAGEKHLVAYVVPYPGQEPGSEELRGHLKERLPEYMMPALFTRLRALPVTPNGKLDRKGLPEPERPAPEAAFQAPATAFEERLAKIWCRVLGIDRVGRHDNFFELGGDSILAIRIVAQAREAGMPLGATDLFQRPSLAEIGALHPDAGPALADVSQEVPLTPIQRWFFERDLVNPHHYNQGALLTAPEDVPPEVVLRSWAAGASRHHARRMVDRRSDAGWRQNPSAEAGATSAVHVDLRALPQSARRTAGRTVMASLQRRLDIEHGPLLRAAFLSTGEAGADRLGVVIHHLAVDVTSWLILAEQLRAACRGPLGGRRGEPATARTSFERWARRLSQEASDPELEREIPLWTAMAHRPPAHLPRDFDGGPGRIDSTRRVRVELDARKTRWLQREVPRAYRTLTHEVLLTALAQALRRLTGERQHLVDLEGNGREIAFDDVDVRQTLGWMTTMYPVLLELPDEEGCGAALVAIKERLRSIPREGIGYGLLRYGTHRAVAEQLRALPPAEVSFLYLGGLAEVKSGGDSFVRKAEPVGATIGPANSRSHLLEVQARIAGGRLQVEFAYSEEAHRRATVAGLAENFSVALEQLIEHCRTPAAGGATPSDFPEAHVSQDELDELMAQFSEDEA